MAAQETGKYEKACSIDPKGARDGTESRRHVARLVLVALTFDEFGMWLHLGGGHWQRASFDAITVVAGFLALMAFGPSVKEMRGKHAITIALLLILAAAFFSLLFQTVNKYGGKVHPQTQKPGQAGISLARQGLHRP